eukprot:CAMPEP_0184658464 /NCGR_PEP_ID=MMETSP0308-20130426/25489_1 /TAXON_ID=38269 /ORGANISM="Gloeochaete witrockiana, Strain SAG 46.84" /LENGTH=590 /DNA_ID=CAMNT_0027097457 /DNA_START=907 /DNA_END=2679 /DNA_ORIENTATION=+
MPGIFLYIADFILRMITSRRACTVRSAHGDLATGVVTLLVSCPGFRWEPGQYVRLNVPVVSSLEWHSIMLCGLAQSNELTLHVKAPSSGVFRPSCWSTSLLEQAVLKRINHVRIDGPFGTPPTKEMASAHTSMFICGGIGITACIPLMAHVLSETPSPKRILLHWAVRDRGLAELSSMHALRELIAVDPNLTRKVDMHLYVSSASSLSFRLPDTCCGLGIFFKSTVYPSPAMPNSLDDSDDEDIEQGLPMRSSGARKPLQGRSVSESKYSATTLQQQSQTPALGSAPSAAASKRRVPPLKTSEMMKRPPPREHPTVPREALPKSTTTPDMRPSPKAAVTFVSGDTPSAPLNPPIDNNTLPPTNTSEAKPAPEVMNTTARASVIALLQGEGQSPQEVLAQKEPLDATTSHHAPPPAPESTGTTAAKPEPDVTKVMSSPAVVGLSIGDWPSSSSTSSSSTSSSGGSRRSSLASSSSSAISSDARFMSAEQVLSADATRILDRQISFSDPPRLAGGKSGVKEVAMPPLPSHLGKLSNERMNIGAITKSMSSVRGNLAVYVCGPQPLIDEVYRETNRLVRAGYDVETFHLSFSV